MKDKIKSIARELGADICGIASIDRFVDAPEGYSPLDIFPECRSVISLGVALPEGLTKVQPRLVYGRFNYFSCDILDTVAFKLANRIEKELGACAVPMPSDGPYEYWEEDTLTGRGLISMKHTAVQAGLGSIGKNTLFISSEAGNLVTLGAVLTDLDLGSDPLCEPLCIEGCNRCLKSCPVGAIRDGSVVQELCRNNTYHQNARGFDTVDCNACRLACPMRRGKGKINPANS